MTGEVVSSPRVYCALPMAVEPAPGPITVETASSAVDSGLSSAANHAQQLDANVRVLQGHFQRAQDKVAEIGKLCDDAEASVRRSQTLLNRSARDMHALNERTRHLLGTSAPTAAAESEANPVVTQPAQGGRLRIQH